MQPTRSVAIKQLNNETSDVAPVSTGATLFHCIADWRLAQKPATQHRFQPVQPTRSVAIKQLNNETSGVAPVLTGATHTQRRHQTAQ
ncbi:hypothetical protein [Chloroflexus sp. MS-CIW-1]|uniref:hypothetical protein n=1 Tax=Chloroflexus sp. MS-CIW-1 TaxID=3055768 RepID=UPI003982DFA1